jgi:hypothetical protein
VRVRRGKSPRLLFLLPPTAGARVEPRPRRQRAQTCLLENHEVRGHPDDRERLLLGLGERRVMRRPSAGVHPIRRKEKMLRLWGMWKWPIGRTSLGLTHVQERHLRRVRNIPRAPRTPSPRLVVFILLRPRKTAQSPFLSKPSRTSQRSFFLSVLDRSPSIPDSSRKVPDSTPRFGKQKQSGTG